MTSVITYSNQYLLEHMVINCLVVDDMLLFGKLLWIWVIELTGTIHLIYTVAALLKGVTVKCYIFHMLLTLVSHYIFEVSCNLKMSWGLQLKVTWNFKNCMTKKKGGIRGCELNKKEWGFDKDLKSDFLAIIHFSFNYGKMDTKIDYPQPA